MSDLEEKLNAILSDSKAMGQIMNLARTLGAGQATASSDSPSVPSAENPPVSQPSSPMNAIDPRILNLALKALNAYNSDDDKRANLLNALRPFVREERYGKLDHAIQISKIARTVRIVLDSLRGGEGGSDNV